MSWLLSPPLSKIILVKKLFSHSFYRILGTIQLVNLTTIINYTLKK